jgi:hypothetical protein
LKPGARAETIGFGSTTLFNLCLNSVSPLQPLRIDEVMNLRQGESVIPGENEGMTSLRYKDAWCGEKHNQHYSPVHIVPWVILLLFSSDYQLIIFRYDHEARKH